jgi:hydrogenase maturation protease
MERCSMSSAPSLVIGYGNVLHADDGIGVRVGRAWQAAGRQAIATTQLLPEHAEAIARAARVIFVDCHVGLSPGEVSVLAIEPHRPGLHAPSSPASLLELARHLYGGTPVAHLIGIGPQALELREGLSDIDEAAVPRVLEQIEALLHD